MRPEAKPTPIKMLRHTGGKTNITEEHKAMFAAVRDPANESVALLSCYFESRPAAAIVLVNEDEERKKFNIAPMFIAVDDSMLDRLVDHDGKPPGFGDAEAMKHAVEALRDLAKKKCNKKNCGTVCLCPPCHARKALEKLDPEWRP